MKKITLSLSLLLTLFVIAACSAGSAPQTQTETAAPTETAIQPTALPASTDTSVPATDTPTEAAATEAATESAASTGVSYAADVKPIFDAKCIKCHGVESTKEGLDMQTYENVMAGSRNGSVITPGNADDSELVRLIVRGKMPNRGQKLSDEEIQLITDWVNQGALNN